MFAFLMLLFWSWLVIGGLIALLSWNFAAGVIVGGCVALPFAAAVWTWRYLKSAASRL